MRSGVSGSPSAEIGKAINVVVPFVIAVSTHVSQSDGAFCGEYGVRRRLTSAASSMMMAGVMVPIAQVAASLLSGRMMPLPLWVVYQPVQQDFVVFHRVQ